MSFFINFKVFEIKLDLEEGIIKNLAIQGDFFDTKPLLPFEEQFKDQPYDKKSIESILSKNRIEDYVLDAKTEDFKALIIEGIIGE